MKLLMFAMLICALISNHRANTLNKYIQTRLDYCSWQNIKHQTDWNTKTPEHDLKSRFSVTKRMYKNTHSSFIIHCLNSRSTFNTQQISFLLLLFLGWVLLLFLGWRFSISHKPTGVGRYTFPTAPSSKIEAAVSSVLVGTPLAAYRPWFMYWASWLASSGGSSHRRAFNLSPSSLKPGLCPSSMYQKLSITSYLGGER